MNNLETLQKYLKFNQLGLKTLNFEDNPLRKIMGYIGFLKLFTLRVRRFYRICCVIKR